MPIYLSSLHSFIVVHESCLWFRKRCLPPQIKRNFAFGNRSRPPDSDCRWWRYAVPNENRTNVYSVNRCWAPWMITSQLSSLVLVNFTHTCPRQHPQLFTQVVSVVISLGDFRPVSRHHDRDVVSASSDVPRRWNELFFFFNYYLISFASVLWHLSQYNMEFKLCRWLLYDVSEYG